MRGSEECATGDDVVTLREERGEHGEDRGHPRRGGDAVLCTLEQAQLLDELVGARVRVAAIDRSLDLLGKEGAGLLGALEGEGRGEEERDRMLAMLRAAGLGADGEGLRLHE